jgi:hypothetical protein
VPFHNTSRSSTSSPISRAWFKASTAPDQSLAAVSVIAANICLTHLVRAESPADAATRSAAGRGVPLSAP